MFDARYFAYATISALLVISPGATMAVVMETVMGEGRLAGLFTVLGINVGNSTLALCSALGMSVVFHAWPSTLQAVKIGGAAYLTYLGLRGLWFAWKGRAVAGPARTQGAGDPARSVSFDPSTGSGPPRASSRGDVGAGGGEPRRTARAPYHGGETATTKTADVHSMVKTGLVRGITTNLLNPPVVLFYMTFLPQFIAPRDPFFARFLVLAGTHVGMSLVWLSLYAFALGVLADRFARPAVRRTLEGLTGVLLVGFGVRLLLR